MSSKGHVIFKSRDHYMNTAQALLLSPKYHHEFVMLNIMQVLTCLRMNLARIPYMQFAMAGVDGRHLQETKMDAPRRAIQFIPLLTTIRGQWEGRSYVLFFADCFSMNGGPTF